MAVKTVKTEATPRKLQLLTVVVLGGTYALQWVFALNTVLQQVQTNGNLSSYANFFIGQFVVPIIFFAGAYLLSPRTISKVGKVFESLLIMLIGQMAMQWMVQVAMIANAAFPPANPGEAFNNFIWYDIAGVLTAVIAYFAILVWLRNTKRWK